MHEAGRLVLWSHRHKISWKICKFINMQRYDKKSVYVEYACVYHIILSFINFCLFELMRNVPVNSFGHVRTLPPFYRTFTKNEDGLT